MLLTTLENQVLTHAPAAIIEEQLNNVNVRQLLE